MNREEIRRTIDGNLRNAGIGETDVRVQPDPLGGWGIAVVTDGFAGKPLSERKRLTLQGLESLHIEWLDLLTGAEREWAGTLPLDTELEELPLWPEALAREEHIPEDVIFASDLDEDLPRPLIVSFYSLRGGVGRSTGLAYTARILAAQGRKVLCVDMDLEAPGLAALFGCDKDVGEHQGVVELLVHLDQGETPDISKYLVPVIEGEDLYCLLGKLLKKANSWSDYDTFLLFDGLDTDFGSDNFGRRLRDEAIAGLFSFWMENEALLNHLKFKILLREDIWRKLRFENKSHLFGRSVTLTWKEQAPFFKVVLKQALRTPDLRALVECVYGEVLISIKIVWNYGETTRYSQSGTFLLANG